MKKKDLIIVTIFAVVAELERSLIVSKLKTILIKKINIQLTINNLFILNYYNFGYQD